MRVGASKPQPVQNKSAVVAQLDRQIKDLKRKKREYEKAMKAQEAEPASAPGDTGKAEKNQEYAKMIMHLDMIIRNLEAQRRMMLNQAEQNEALQKKDEEQEEDWMESMQDLLANSGSDYVKEQGDPMADSFARYFDQKA